MDKQSMGQPVRVDTKATKERHHRDGHSAIQNILLGVIGHYSIKTIPSIGAKES